MSNSSTADLNLLNSWYSSLEAKFNVVEGSDRGSHLPNRLRNETRPVHSWFNLKESFSAEFPNWVLGRLATEFGYNPGTALDPFVGGGTSLIELARRGVDVVGIEVNPFIAWAANTKASWYRYSEQRLLAAVEQLGLGTSEEISVEIPQLSTLNNERYFRAQDVETLVGLLKRIDLLDFDHKTKDFLRIGVAASILQIANLRRDGRALRYVPKNGIRPQVVSTVQERWQEQLKDLKRLHEPNSTLGIRPTSVFLGSAVNLKRLSTLSDGAQLGIVDQSMELVIYSPPYLNNFDYTELYKLELWLLQFVSSHAQWQDLRRRTLRSHHSIKFDLTDHIGTDPGLSDFSSMLDLMSRSSLLQSYAQQTMPVILKGYFDDLLSCVKEQYRVMRPGGFLVYLVGNSCHSRLPVATDIMIGELARSVGFIPIELRVLRQRKARAVPSRYLRESVVIMRK